jgi:hypothetical protein
MKIHQLPIGARFEYEGQEYVKTGPLLGTGGSGQRLIPKYAVLKPLGGAGAVPEAKPDEPVMRSRVVEALETFHRRCEALVPTDQLAELATARDAFLKDLDR